MLKKLAVAGAVMLYASAAQAAGVLLAPPEVASRYFLRSETAVISVNPDRAVTIDLLLSLRTSSHEAAEVSLVIPLQTAPKTYKVEDTTFEQFEKAHVWEVSALPGKAEEQFRRGRRALRQTCGLSALLVGPCALPLAGFVSPWEPPFVDYRILGQGESPAGTFPVIARTMNVYTYPSLQLDQLTEVAQLDVLPEGTGHVLAGYEGRPFLLARLWCVPDTSPPDPNMPEWYEQPGLHVSLSQTMLPGKGLSAHSYAFPLRPLAAWPSLSYYLRLYVTAPENLNLQVRFPDRQPASDYGAWQCGPGGDAVALNGRQVITTSYSPKHGGANPSGDVQVSLSATGRSKLVAQRSVRDLHLALLFCAYPLLALASWLSACRFVLRRWSGGRARIALGSWFATYGLLILPIGWGGSLLLNDTTYLAFPDVWHWWPWFMDYTYEDYIYARVVPAVVLLAAVLWLIGCLILPRESEVRLSARLGIAVATWLATQALLLLGVLGLALGVSFAGSPAESLSVACFLPAVVLVWLAVRWTTAPLMRALPTGLIWRLPITSVVSAAIYLFGAFLLAWL